MVKTNSNRLKTACLLETERGMPWVCRQEMKIAVRQRLNMVGEFFIANRLSRLYFTATQIPTAPSSIGEKRASVKPVCSSIALSSGAE